MPPRWRLPLLFLGFVSLAFGVAGGLARLVPSLNVHPSAITLHGPLMVSAFFGTVIALERAVALDRLWAYVAPLGAGLGGLFLLFGLTNSGLFSMVIGAAVFCIASAVIFARQPSLEMGVLLGGGVAWLAGNVLLFFGLAAVHWWIAFFVLTIGGERLELSRYLKRGPWVRTAFMLLAIAVLFSALIPRVMGAVLALLALWLLAFDLARITVKQAKLPRYVALCLLAGYFWLAIGGSLMAVEISYDAALHALFVGFVLSMVFGHAPVILPAVLRVRFPYHPVLYAPLALLHVSLAARVLGGFLPEGSVLLKVGAWGNAAAIALFIVTAATLVLSRASSDRLKRSPPGR